MKRILTLGLALLMLALAAAAPKSPTTGSSSRRWTFSLLSGQNGSLGDGSGSQRQQLRRFHVAIDGDVVGDTLTLHERFIYDDGEKQQRVWRIRRTGDHRYEGTAGDIAGVASGQAAGNAFTGATA
jgi:hypothetical protein